MTAEWAYSYLLPGPTRGSRIWRTFDRLPVLIWVKMMWTPVNKFCTLLLKFILMYAVNYAFYSNWTVALFLQEDTPDSAAKHSSATLQPTLFRCQRRLWLKADHTPIEITDAGCFADAIQMLLCVFWIFNVEYPYHLKPTYDLLEVILRLKTIPRSVVARELLRQLESWRLCWDSLSHKDFVAQVTVCLWSTCWILLTVPVFRNFSVQVAVTL